MGKTLQLVQMKFPISSRNTCQKHPSQFFCKSPVKFDGQTISLNIWLETYIHNGLIKNHHVLSIFF